MRTLAEPKQNIAKLWGKQTVKPGETYRLMRYVLRVDHEGKTALHNVVTGQLIVLDADEVQAVDALPTGYAPAMDALIADHYLVPEAYDEHKQVVNLRTILRSLMPKPKYITHYTILPTTACNARCYYCFEQGIKPETMTEETADQVVKFIVEHCGPEKKVRISWFGGEPTVATHRIDQICKGLQAEGITYTAEITSNGYLFDEDMTAKARDLWHIRRIMISVDGVGKTYNNVKAYVNAQDDPYERVMRNVGLLLDAGIHVNLRMNFNVDNYQEFHELVCEASERFKGRAGLNVYVHPIHNIYISDFGVINHGGEEWFSTQVVALNNIARDYSLFNTKELLPSLEFRGCIATSRHAITISSNGSLARCPEQIEIYQQTGFLHSGETNMQLIQAWNSLADHRRCHKCEFFPYCIRVSLCRAGDRCTCKKEFITITHASIWSRIASQNNNEEGENDAVL